MSLWSGINAQSGGEGDPRVKITYTPRATDDDAGADDANGSEDEAAATDEPSEDADDPPGA